MPDEKSREEKKDLLLHFARMSSMGGDASRVGRIIVFNLWASKHKRIEPSVLITVTSGLLYYRSINLPLNNLIYFLLDSRTPRERDGIWFDFIWVMRFNV